MPLYQLTICDWNPLRRDTVIKNPEWDHVREAIEKLNNRNLNDVYLQPMEDDPETFLGIGGGDGRYLVTGVTVDGYPTVIDPNKSASYERLVVGGQEGGYPTRCLVDLATAWENV